MTTEVHVSAIDPHLTRRLGPCPKA